MNYERAYRDSLDIAHTVGTRWYNEGVEAAVGRNTQQRTANIKNE